MRIQYQLGSNKENRTGNEMCNNDAKKVPNLKWVAVKGIRCEMKRMNRKQKRG